MFMNWHSECSELSRKQIASMYQTSLLTCGSNAYQFFCRGNFKNSHRVCKLVWGWSSNPYKSIGVEAVCPFQDQVVYKMGKTTYRVVFTNPATMHNRGIKGIQGQRLLVNAPNFAVHFSTIKQQWGAIFSTLIRQEEPMSTVMTLDLHLV